MIFDPEESPLLDCLNAALDPDSSPTIEDIHSQIKDARDEAVVMMTLGFETLKSFERLLEAIQEHLVNPDEAMIRREADIARREISDLIHNT